MSPMTTDEPPRITTDPDALAALYAATTDRAALRRALVAQEGRRRAGRLWQAARDITSRRDAAGAERRPAPAVNRGGRPRIGARAPSGVGSAAMNTTVDSRRLAALDAYRTAHDVSRNEVMRRAMQAAISRPPRPEGFTADRYPRRVDGTAVVWIPDPEDRARFMRVVARVTPEGRAGRGIVGALMRYGLDRLLNLG